MSVGRGDRVYAPWAAGWRAVLGLCVGLFVLRVAYLVWWCPYTLIEDEAQYWEWSRRLDWSYYSKGPGIAWAIAASTRVFGPGEWAVRLPSAFSLLVMSLAGAGLARDVFKDRRAAFLAAATVNLVPLFQIAGLLMTIDMPYAACWMVGAWAFWRAVSRGSGPWLVLAGVAIGAGFLFKYTALLLVPGLVVFAVVARRRGARLPGAGWWVLALGALAVCLAPVGIWNAQHGWPTVKHLLGHLGVAGGDRPAAQVARAWSYTPRWMLEFLGAQIGMTGPVLGLALVEFLDARRKKKEEPERWSGVLYLVLCAAPILVFYFCVTVAVPAQQNWALAAYTTLGVLGAGAVARGMDDFVRKFDAWRALPEPRPKMGGLLRRPETPVQVLWHMTMAFGLVGGIGFAGAGVMASIPGVGSVIPVHRLTGAGTRAAQVAGLLGSLRGAGDDPFVMAHHYGVAAQMAYYLPGRPVVYCSSAYTGGRRTQYDFFADTDLARVMPVLVGRAGVVLGATEGQWGDVFERVEAVGKLEGEKKDDRPAFVGRGFKGFPLGVTAR